jgi:hypothetical protein
MLFFCATGAGVRLSSGAADGHVSGFLLESASASGDVFVSPVSTVLRRTGEKRRMKSFTTTLMRTMKFSS